MKICSLRVRVGASVIKYRNGRGTFWELLWVKEQRVLQFDRNIVFSIVMVIIDWLIDYQLDSSPYRIDAPRL